MGRPCPSGTPGEAAAKDTLYVAHEGKLRLWAVDDIDGARAEGFHGGRHISLLVEADGVRLATQSQLPKECSKGQVGRRRR